MIKELKKLNCRNSKIETLFISVFLGMIVNFIGMTVDSANVGATWDLISTVLYSVSDICIVYALYCMRKENKNYRNAFYLFAAGTVCGFIGILNILKEVMLIINDMCIMFAIFQIYDAMLKTVKKGQGTRAVMLGQCGGILNIVVDMEDAVWMMGLLGKIFLSDIAPSFILIADGVEDTMYFSIQTLIVAFAAAMMFIDEKVTDD